MAKIEVKEIIKLKNIHKKYNEGKQNEVYALRGVDLEVSKGESIAIMGVSGSGKSTLLNIIGCLDNFSDGEYFLRDENITTKNATELAEIRNATFGFVLQSYGLIDSDKVINNVRIPLLFSKKYKPSEQNDRIDTVLSKLKIVELKNKKVRDLSGGQKQRVAIARALVNDPDVILADEPTSALDSDTASEIIGVLKDLQKQGKTIIVVTHDINVANKLDRIVTIKDGVLSWFEKQEKILLESYFKLSQKQQMLPQYLLFFMHKIIIDNNAFKRQNLVIWYCNVRMFMI